MEQTVVAAVKMEKVVAAVVIVLMEQDVDVVAPEYALNCD